MIQIFLIPVIMSNIASITVDTAKGLRMSNLIETFTQKQPIFNLVDVVNIPDQENILTITEIYKKFKDLGIRDVFAYLPSINPEALNSISSTYGIFTLNAVSNDMSTCLKNVVYGFDTCHSKYLCIYTKHLL